MDEMKRTTGLAWNRMAVIGLNFMFRARHVLDEFLYTIYTLARVAVPCQCRCGTVELWQVICTCGRVVGGVVQAGEVICGPRRYIYTEGGVSRYSSGLA